MHDEPFLIIIFSVWAKVESQCFHLPEIRAISMAMNTDRAHKDVTLLRCIAIAILF